MAAKTRLRHPPGPVPHAGRCAPWRWAAQPSPPARYQGHPFTIEGAPLCELSAPIGCCDMLVGARRSQVSTGLRMGDGVTEMGGQPGGPCLFVWDRALQGCLHP